LSAAAGAPITFRAPVFAREAAAMFRRRRTYLMQVAFLGGLFVALMLLWPHGEGDAAERGRDCFKLFAALELAVAALLAPALAAPAIATEREKETLGLLAIAGASPYRILAGKALGRLAQVVVLVAISLPLVGALFVVGGLSPGEVGTIFVEAIALAALGVGVGSLFSATTRRPETAVVYAFLAIIFLAGVPEALARAGLPVPAHHLSPYSWYEAVFNPLAATGEVVFASWYVAPILHALLGAAAIVAGGYRLERAGYEPHKAATYDIPLKRLLLRMRKRGGPLGLTGRFGTEVAALRWRERSVRTFSDGALIVALGLFLVLFEVFAPAKSRDIVRNASAIGLAALATLLATVLGAAAVSRERDQKTLEPLAAAPIEAEQFLVGKLLGLGRAVLICGAAVVLHLVLGVLRGDMPWASVFAVAGTIPFGLALHAVVGLSCSCHCETTVRSTAWALALAVAIAAFSWVSCMFYGLSPAAFIAQLAMARAGSGSAGLRSPESDALQWLAVAVAAALFAAAVAVVAWNHLRARFDMLVGRAALDIIALPDIMPPS
jgi:ABC-type transport system involved in multi-copper enzyme maturation permease subunit